MGGELNSKVNDIGSVRLSEIQIKWLYRVSLLVLVFTALRGARFPSLWTYSHYLFNYEFGFVKRGLIGEIVRLIDSDFIRSYDFFFMFSSTILLIDLMLIAIVLKRLFYKGDIALIGIGFCYASSVAVVFLVHTIGYFDHIGLMICLAMLLIKDRKYSMTVGVTAFPVLLFIHEGLIVIFGPFISLMLLSKLKIENRFQIIILAFYILGVCLCTLIVSDCTISPESSMVMQKNFEKKLSMPLRADAFQVLSTSSVDNRALMSSFMTHIKSYYELFYSFLVTLPCFFLSW